MINFSFNRGDIISTSNNLLYLVLDDVTLQNDRINVFHIGTFYNRVNLIFNTKNVFRESLINNGYYSLISDRHMLHEAIEDESYERYLDIIEERTGIDLREMEDYKEYLIKKDAGKYNL